MANEPDENPWTRDDPHRNVDEQRVAERFKKSVRTLQRWRSEGYGPAFMRIGGTVHYRVGDVLDFEDAQRQGGEGSL